MTPLQIQMMLHYYARPSPYAAHEPEHASSQAVAQQRLRLLSDELLYVDPTSGAGYALTDRGRAYISALTAMPLPIKKWVMPGAA